MNTRILEVAYARRAVARTDAAAAAAALSTGERLSADAVDKISDLEQKLSKIEASQGQHLAATIAAARPADITAEGFANAGRLTCAPLAAELATARFHAAVAAHAVASLKVTSYEAEAELAAAEAAVAAAVDGILEAGDIEIAAQLARLLDEAVRLGKALLFGAIGAEVIERRSMPPQVTSVLARLDGALIDRRHVSVNLWRYGDKAALDDRSARRAAMIAGESATVETAAA
jgi:hypothetical protein